MTSGEIRHSTNEDIESLVGSDTSHFNVRPHDPYEAAMMVEASLVNDDPVPDDEWPSMPAPPNFTASTADGTQMTNTTKASPIVEALPMDEYLTVKDFFQTRKVQCILIALGAAFVVLALGTVYSVTGFSKRMSSVSNSTALNYAPTNPPTSAGDLNLKYFLEVAIPEDTRKALRRENSPQTKALRWLRNNTLLASYDISRRMQRFALATLYFSTDGDRRWLKKDGWLSDDDECSWFFTANQEGKVRKPCDNGVMIAFYMVENNMRGTLPLEMSFLTSLQTLEMPGNIITGFLPTTLGQLSLLQSIHLFNNFLSGTVPNELGDALNLEIIDVGEK